MSSITEQAIAKETDWSKIYDLADTYRKQQQWHTAAIAFRRAIELRPDFFWSYHHLGDVLTELKQWQQAAIVYGKAVKIDPQFFWSWHNLGDSFSKLKQWQQAAFAYNRAVELDPSFFWSWHNLGDAVARLKQWDRAISIYLQGIQLQPEHQRIYQKLGTVLQQRGSLEESIKYYCQLIRSPQENYVFQNLQAKPQILVNIAENLARFHQTVGAIILYSTVLEIVPHQSQIVQRIAQLKEKYYQLQTRIASSKANSFSQLLQQSTIAVPPANTLREISGEIVIKENSPVTPQQLSNLFQLVGWPPRSHNKILQSLENSFCHTTVWHLHEQKAQLIGFARAISDGVFHAVLLDILIHPQFQNRGWGKRLVQNMIKQLQQADIWDISLFTSPHVMDFYHRLGFISEPNNLQLMLWSAKLVDIK